MSSAADERVHLPADRLARALDVPRDRLEDALIHVGVTPDYLVRALYDGDPQRTFPTLAERLDRERADVVLAVVKALVGAGLLDSKDVPRILDAAFRHVQDDATVRARVDVARRAREPAAGVPDVALPAPVAPGAAARAEAEAVAQLMGHDLPRLARRLKAAAVVAGVAAIAIGVLGFVAPEAFRVTVWILAAGGFVAAGAGLLVVAWRLHGAGKRLRAFSAALAER